MQILPEKAPPGNGVYGNSGFRWRRWQCHLMRQSLTKINNFWSPCINLVSLEFYLPSAYELLVDSAKSIHLNVFYIISFFSLLITVTNSVMSSLEQLLRCSWSQIVSFVRWNSCIKCVVHVSLFSMLIGMV